MSKSTKAISNNDRIAALEAITKKQIKEIAVLQGKYEVERMKVNNIMGAEDFLSRVREESKELHAKLQAMIVRITVATEVSYCYRAEDQRLMTLNNVIKLFDKHDDWWAERRHKTLEWWKAEIDNKH